MALAMLRLRLAGQAPKTLVPMVAGGMAPNTILLRDVQPEKAEFPILVAIGKLAKLRDLQS